ncbi:12544_t:CDS:2 [Ambispora leptoticha]|uniref:12544_t:CDS:1 n=1 Tax=Ambispora leptoticha TaxID=144679 RepID=A0A9N9GXF8_9GLOM|nr:12544_t:CDS:2 [Ambispora leptoticha]
MISEREDCGLPSEEWENKLTTAQEEYQQKKINIEELNGYLTELAGILAKSNEEIKREITKNTHYPLTRQIVQALPSDKNNNQEFVTSVIDKEEFEQQKARISAKHQEDTLEKIEQTDKEYQNLTHKGTFLSQNLDFQKLSTIVNDFDNFFAKLAPQSQMDYLVQLLVNILQPFPQKDYEVVIYDPCCGSGGMFIQSQEFITKNKKARMNLLLHGLNPKLGERAEDTFKEDLHPQKKADYVITNPPFNISDYC